MAHCIPVIRPVISPHSLSGTHSSHSASSAPRTLSPPVCQTTRHCHPPPNHRYFLTAHHLLKPHPVLITVCTSRKERILTSPVFFFSCGHSYLLLLSLPSTFITNHSPPSLRTPKSQIFPEHDANPHPLLCLRQSFHGKINTSAPNQNPSHHTSRYRYR